jgi:hypothetical protein
MISSVITVVSKHVAGVTVAKRLPALNQKDDIICLVNIRNLQKPHI